MAAPDVDDPTERSRWRPLRLLQQRMDADIARIYLEAGIEGLRPSFVFELIRLGRRGPMTISELAVSVDRTHSAMSQKVALLKRAGLVRTVPGPDARSKHIVLTARAERLVDRLAAEWRATEAAVSEIEAELPFSIEQYVAAVEQALARTSFHDRITEHLAADPAWSPDGPPVRPTASDDDPAS